MEQTNRCRKANRNINTINALLFIAPNFIGFLLFTLIPVSFSLIVSFTNWDLFSGIEGMKFVGLDNIAAMMKDIWFLDSIKNNFIYTFGTIPVILVLALITAVMLNKKIYGRNLFRMMFFMPYISNIVAVSTIWLMLYNPKYGLINQVLRSIGLQNPPGWIASTEWALPALMIISVWTTLGYNAVIYLANLQMIDRSLYEAAEIDGANGMQKMLKITVPLLSPTTFFLLTTNIITSFQVFGQINIMTQGGPGRATTVIAFYIYKAGFSFFKMGYAASIAWVLFIMIFIFTLIQWKGQKKWVEY